MIKQDTKPYNTNGKRHGYWEVYYFNGNLWFKGYYINGNRHGLCEEYNNKTFYI